MVGRGYPRRYLSPLDADIRATWQHAVARRSGGDDTPHQLSQQSLARRPFVPNIGDRTPRELVHSGSESFVGDAGSSVMAGGR